MQIRDEANEQLFGSGFSAFLATLSLIGLPKEEHAVIQSCSVGHLREGKGICLALEVLKRSAKAAEETLSPAAKNVPLSELEDAICTVGNGKQYDFRKTPTGVSDEVFSL